MYTQEEQDRLNAIMMLIQQGAKSYPDAGIYDERFAQYDISPEDYALGICVRTNILGQFSHYWIVMIGGVTDRYLVKNINGVLTIDFAIVA